MSWTPALACLRAQARTLGGRAVAQPSQLRLLSVTRTAAKSKRSSASEPAPPTPGDVPVIHTKGKGAKGASKAPRGARSKRGDAEEAERDDSERYSTSTGNEELPGERFDEQGLRENMERAVKRCRETISQKVASHGRADPGACMQALMACLAAWTLTIPPAGLLDSVRVSFSSTGQSTSGSTSSGSSDGVQSYNLKEFATVGVKDGALLVTCFDAEVSQDPPRAHSVLASLTDCFDPPVAQARRESSLRRKHWLDSPAGPRRRGCAAIAHTAVRRVQT